MEHPPRKSSPVRRPRPATRNYRSRILKPAKKKSHIVVWIGVPLLLLVVGAAALCLSSESDEVKMYRKAAEEGDAEAMYELGRCYSLGEGIKKDEVKAANWFLKSAKKGNVHQNSRRRVRPRKPKYRLNIPR